MLRKMLASIFMLTFMIGLFSAPSFAYDHAVIKEGTDARFNNPLYADKEVLNYLLWTVDEKLENDVIALQQTFQLSDDQMEQLRNWGLKERQLIQAELTSFQFEDTQNVDLFNSIASRVFQERNTALKELFGEQYPLFEEWIAVWWQNEIEYRNKWLHSRASIQADKDKIVGIFATQYLPNTSGAYEVALPDKYVKFANLGWKNDIPSHLRSTYGNPPYTVNIYNPDTNKSVRNVKVDDVGPWNTDDNYWDSKNGNNPRRKFTDLSLGSPQAYEAYTNGHNGGKDQSGRKVLNPAGIDLTPNVAADLGLKLYQNAWVDVRYESLP